MVPAAGLPWFMTLFGRDTLITSLQELLLGPEPAAGALRALAEAQADVDDPERDAEPGKIVHELRRGKTALIWTDRYYGTVDATPLFLVLLSELWRWTGDDAIVLELEQRGAARARLDRRLRRPRRRRLRRVPAPRDARHRQPELEGLVQLDGLPRRLARARADRAGRGAGLRLRREAAHRGARAPRVATTRRRRRVSSARRRRCASGSTRRSGSRSAAGTRSASTRDKRPVDALASNMGHLLWSGIVPADRVAEVAARLTSGPLWSGWGVRTLAADEAAFDPLEYHNGTVWPHDNSLIALGLAQAGRPEEAERGRAGAPRLRTLLRVPAAGALRRHERRRRRGARGRPQLRAAAGVGRRDAAAPAPRAARARAGSGCSRPAGHGGHAPGLDRGLRARRRPAFGRRWRVRVENGAATVES